MGVKLAVSQRRKATKISYTLQPYAIEYPSNVQIKDFLGRPVWCRFEWASPCCSGVGDEYIQFIFCLLDFLHQALDIFDLCNVCWYANSLTLDTGELVQLLDCLIDPFRASRFPSGYNDFSRASKQKCCSSMEAESSRS